MQKKKSIRERRKEILPHLSLIIGLIGAAACAELFDVMHEMSMSISLTAYVIFVLGTFIVAALSFWGLWKMFSMTFEDKK